MGESTGCHGVGGQTHVVSFAQTPFPRGLQQLALIRGWNLRVELFLPEDNARQETCPGAGTSLPGPAGKEGLRRACTHARPR